jgi:hypothetical protein
MNPKSKKELADQGSSVAQAVKWIGGAIFGDPDDVLDDMVERAEEQERARGRRSAPRTAEPPRVPKRRRPQAAPPPEVIDVEGFIEDDDDGDER